MTVHPVLCECGFVWKLVAMATGKAMGSQFYAILNSRLEAHKPIMNPAIIQGFFTLIMRDVNSLSEPSQLTVLGTWFAGWDCLGACERGFAQQPVSVHHVTSAAVACGLNRAP